MDEVKQAELFKVLSVETRIRIIEILKEKGAMGVKELAKLLEITPSAVSQHLKVLRYAGLVHSERKGYWLPYEIDEAALEHCGKMLSDVCTCGCRKTGRGCQKELDAEKLGLEALRKHEQELKRRLEEMQVKIRELESKQ